MAINPLLHCFRSYTKTFSKCLLIQTSLFALLASAGISFAADPNVIHVLLVGGQSNADGRANPTDLPTSPVNLQLPQDNIIFNSGTSLTTLRPRATEFGPEITFGKSMGDFYAPYGEKVAILKYAAGGTNLHTQWKAGGTATASGDGEYYTNFQNQIKAALGTLRLTYPNSTIVLEGMIWVQGESDIDNGNGAVTSANYGANLTQLISDIRQTFQPDLRFFLSEISINQTSLTNNSTKLANFNTLRSGQLSVVANVPRTYLIDTDGANFTMKSDNLHYDAGGQQALGYAFATAMQANLPIPTANVQNVTAVAGTRQVSLTWNSYSDALTYNVKRATSPEGPYTTITTSLSSNSYVDTGLTAGTPYYYVVTAITNIGETDNSALVWSTPFSIINTTPSTLRWDPSQTGVSSDGSGTWDNFTANFANNGANVLYGPSSASNVFVAPFVTGATTITVDNTIGLVPGLGISLSQFSNNTVISSISGRTLTMSNPASAPSNSITVATFSPLQDVIFGSNQAAAGLITIAGNQGANSMTINPSASGAYTFTGDIINIGSNKDSTGYLTLNAHATFNNMINIPKTITFNSANKILTLNGGGNAINTVNGSGSNGASSSVIVNGGLYTGFVSNIQIGTLGTTESFGSNGLIINGGNVAYNGTLNIGNGGSGLITVNTGGALTTRSSGVPVGRGTNNSGKLVINGGTFNSSVPLLIGFEGATSGIMNIAQGVVTLSGQNASGDLVINSKSGSISTTATVLISGGVTTIGSAGAVTFGNGGGFSISNAGTGALKMTGGSLYVGSGGIVNVGGGTFSSSVNLSGGTIGARAAWSSNMPMTLDTTNGNIIFRTADANNTSYPITLNGALSGAGGLTKSGGGDLILSAANTYTGATQITAGSVILTGNGSISNSSTIDIKSGSTLNVSGLTAPLQIASSQTLTGAGSVTGPVTSAGVIAPGNGIGTLTVGGATQVSGTLNIEVNGTTSDKLHSTGAVNLNGAALNVSLLGGGFTQSSYVIADGTSLTGTFTSVTPGYAVVYSATQAILVKNKNYAGWAIDNGIIGQPASGDFDGDGISNLLEYALGLNPKSSNSTPGTLNNGLVTFSKGAQAVTNGDLIYTIEKSTTLGDASDPWTAVTPTTNNTNVISFQLPPGMPRQFIRLKVTQAP